MVTFQAKKEQMEKNWFVVDAEGKVLGRLASHVATVLRGKNKPIFTPHIDTGDCVIIVNAKKVRLTGKKVKDKIYYHHSGYPGGIKSINARDLLEKKPEEVVRKAVRGMLPKNRLGRKMLKKLWVYPDREHPHQAQQPQQIDI